MKFYRLAIYNILFVLNLLCFSGYCQENISLFDNESLPVLNDELRKLRNDIRSAESSITTLTTSISALDFDGKHFISGLELEYDNDDNVVVYPGAVEIDGTVLVSTADTDVSLGGTPSNGWHYIYAYNNSDTIAFYTSTTAPNAHDADNDTDGTLYFLLTGGVKYRCIGQVYVSSNAIVVFYQNGNYYQFDTFISVSHGATSTANIPVTSTQGYFELYVLANASLNALAKIRPAGSSGNYFSSPSIIECYTYTVCMTNSSQQVDCSLATGGGGAQATCKTVGYWVNIRD